MRLDEEDGRLAGSADFRRARGVPDGHLTIGEIAAHTGIKRRALVRMFRAHRIASTMRSPGGWLLYPVSILQSLHLKGIPRPGRAKKLDEVANISKVHVPGVEPISYTDRDLVSRYGGGLRYRQHDALRVFDRLRAGDKPSTIAVELRDIHPQVLARICEDYARLDRVIFVPLPILQKLEMLSLDGTFPLETAEHIFELCASAVSELVCRSCEKGTRTWCKACARSLGKNEYLAARARARENAKLAAHHEAEAAKMMAKMEAEYAKGAND